MRDFENDRKICEVASKGPWRAVERGNSVTSFAVVTVAYEGMPQKNICSAISPKTEDATFIAAAHEGWPAALAEIESLKRQLKMAAETMSCFCGCPWQIMDIGCEQEPNCNKYTDVSIDCWLEYWRRKSGAFQNGNDHGTISGKETVGEEQDMSELPNNCKRLREQLKKSLEREAAIEKELEEARTQVALLRGALETLVKKYIRNKGTEYQFVTCMTPQGTPDFWESAINALSTTPAESAERVNALVEVLEWIEKTTQDTGAQDAASDALAAWRGKM